GAPPRERRAVLRTMPPAPHDFTSPSPPPAPPKGSPRTRHYGLLASARCKANIARAKELMAVPVPVMDPPAGHDDADREAGTAADHRPPCPCCGGRMIIVETFERGAAPPAPPSPQARGRTAMPLRLPVPPPTPPPAGEPCFRRCIAVAPAPPKARATPSIVPKPTRQRPPRRQTPDRYRRSAADPGPRIPDASRRPTKSP